MNCNRCGFLLADNSKFCENCGNKIDNNNINITNNVNNNKPSFFQNKRKLIIIGASLIFIVLVIVLVIALNNRDGNSKRKETLTSIKETNHVKYKFGEDELYLGKEVSTYLDKGYTYDTDYITDDDYVLGDSISMITFYKDNEPKFLGALYCPKDDKCTYEESTLVKINFYEDKNLLIDDFIKYGLSYNAIVEKYGKEDGKFYQNEELLVWTFGEKGKIGEPYYILRFDNGGLFSTNTINDIRIGVWWYDGEYEHTVIKNSLGDVLNEEK